MLLIKMQSVNTNEHELCAELKYSLKMLGIFKLLETFLDCVVLQVEEI